MRQLKITASGGAAEQALLRPRKTIDMLDRKIMGLLARRFECVREVGRIKRAAGLPVVSRKREMEVVRKLLGYSDLSGKFVKDFYKLILREAYRLEKQHK